MTMQDEKFVSSCHLGTSGLSTEAMNTLTWKDRVAADWEGDAFGIADPVEEIQSVLLDMLSCIYVVGKLCAPSLALGP